MGFDLDKKNSLSKLDKSQIGAIDSDILPLCNLINSSDDYYTTSSCAGRIVIQKVPDDYTKNHHCWLLESHDPVTFDQVKVSLLDLPDETVWLREESLILHVACRTLEHASSLLKLVRDDFKRSGIISDKKIVVEIASTEHMDVPIARDKKMLIDDAYLKFLVEEANRKLTRTKEKIKDLAAVLAVFFGSL